jgi:predicted HNH restriction endonuclease
VRQAKDKPCADCGVKYPTYVMDFHHRDPATKEFVIALSASRSREDVIAEIDKCDVLCANCHRIRHHHRGD